MITPGLEVDDGRARSIHGALELVEGHVAVPVLGDKPGLAKKGGHRFGLGAPGLGRAQRGVKHRLVDAVVSGNPPEAQKKESCGDAAAEPLALLHHRNLDEVGRQRDPLGFRDRLGSRLLVVVVVQCVEFGVGKRGALIGRSLAGKHAVQRSAVDAEHLGRARLVATGARSTRSM